MNRSPHHRIIALSVLFAILATAPMVLCAQVETCTMAATVAAEPTSNMDDCEMPGGDCCFGAPAPAPTPSTDAGNSLQIAAVPPISSMAIVVDSSLLREPRSYRDFGDGRTGAESPIAIYTLLATLLI